MAVGTVKWFSNAKGYGFIVTEEGDEDIFAHFSVIEMEGYKTLKQGQTVEFEASPGPKGLQATWIRAVEQKGQEGGSELNEDAGGEAGQEENAA
ncbi:MAG TPA: hypothetical protein ENK54_05045 [Thiotrichales bacterium]|nr:hypothetical protein [Thiotrichales bacterium]